MNNKYEISIWKDVPSDDGLTFHEKKLIVIGSDTMTSESRAREPKLVTNINGTNKFTFNMYYNYIDTRTGEKVKNPYIKYLVNERKIKVFWKGDWYDLLIKQIKEDQVQHIFTYTCEDAFVTELSRTGFNLTFNTELENNIGTAQELIENVIADTDWKFDPESDQIYQETEEAVYEITVENNFLALQNPLDTEVEIIKGHSLLLFYSYAPDINNLKDGLIQFYYSTEPFQQDVNDMLVINGGCYSVNVTWDIDDTVATAFKDGIKLFSINFVNGLSMQYRAKRFVQSQKSVYNNILDRYVNVYTKDNQIIYGYNTTDFGDALAVVNIVANPSNFANTSGWIGEDLYFKLSPAFDGNTDIKDYRATSYLHLDKGNYFNTGIQNNRPYTPNGYTIGDRYIFRIKAYAHGAEPGDFLNTGDAFTITIEQRDIQYNPIGNPYFELSEPVYISETEDTTGPWLEYIAECITSCPYDKILSVSEPFGIFLKTKQPIWLQELQFFKEEYGTTSYEPDAEIIRINPNEVNRQSIVQSTWKYFTEEAISEPGVTKDNLVYCKSLKYPWDEVIPVTNHYQRYGTIEADNSNRFNILQTIAETFECWIRFKVKHDLETGYILHDETGAPKKYISIQKEAGQETGIGFIYGIDLKSIVRNIKSDKISTKTIVEQNENEFGKNGFCTIARSEQNYPRENFIYNFDYYIQQQLLDKNTVYNDLFGTTTGLRYYSQLHNWNTLYASNLESLTNKKAELTRQKSALIVYNQYIQSLYEELSTVEDSLIKLAAVDNIEDATTYAAEHIKFTKVQSLINDRSTIKNTILHYETLQEEITESISILENYITQLNADQNSIINNLTRLNKQFYSKYSRFIQEGTWTSEDYWDDDLYYLDAVQVAYESSRPQISYDINVLRLSDIPEYSSKVFQLGDISYIQDTEYFGYKDKFTPYKEKVVLTEITSFFETPEKDVIKVQNYKSQFDDLFQRITAAVQNLEFAEGKYAKAANIMASDGTIRSNVIQNTFNENKDLVYGAQNESATINNTGITVTDNADATKQVKVTSGGVFITNDGGNTWKNAIRGDGITADVITTGKLNTENITIYGADSPSFTWDQYGINAYMIDEGGQENSTYIVAEDVTADNFSEGIYYYLKDDIYVLATEFNSEVIYYAPSRATNYNQFVRFDKYGLYGLKNQEDNYAPTSESQIYRDANFGLTWNKFFMKSSNTTSGGKVHSIEISTERDIVVKEGDLERVVIGRVDTNDESNYGIHVNDSNGDVVFNCDNNGASLAGWTLTKDKIYNRFDEQNRSIEIRSDGNIGCYGQNAGTRKEWTYRIQVERPFVAIDLTTNTPRDISQNVIIYPFVNSIGKLKTQMQMEGDVQQSYKTPTGIYIPTYGNEVSFIYRPALEDINYIVEDVVLEPIWTGTETKTETITVDGGKTATVTTYTYSFKIEVKQNDQMIFEIKGTEKQEEKIRYLPASDTTWLIDKNGYAIFHNITADGGTIAGWYIDNESIYQTYDGTPNKIKDGKNNVKTELSSTGMARQGEFDYSIITDAINAQMASIGGILMSSGRINGYNIATIAAQAANAISTANSAMARANEAYSHLPKHTHSFSSNANRTSMGDGSSGWHDHAFSCSGTTGPAGS